MQHKITMSYTRDYPVSCWTCGHKLKESDIFEDVCNKCSLKDVTPPDTILETDTSKKK